MEAAMDHFTINDFARVFASWAASIDLGQTIFAIGAAVVALMLLGIALNRGVVVELSPTKFILRIEPAGSATTRDDKGAETFEQSGPDPPSQSPNSTAGLPQALPRQCGNMS